MVVEKFSIWTFTYPHDNMSCTGFFTGLRSRTWCDHAALLPPGGDFNRLGENRRNPRKTRRWSNESTSTVHIYVFKHTDIVHFNYFKGLACSPSGLAYSGTPAPLGSLRRTFTPDSFDATATKHFSSFCPLNCIGHTTAINMKTVESLVVWSNKAITNAHTVKVIYTLAAKLRARNFSL